MVKQVKALLVERLQIRKAKNIVPKKKRSQTWLFPQSQENKYTKVLLSLKREIQEKIKQVLFPAIPSMYFEVNSKTPQDRKDDYLSDIRRLIEFIKQSLAPKITSSIFNAVRIGEEINKFNYQQFQKVNESVLSVNIFVNEPWLEDQLKLFASQNAQLIRSIPDQELERVAGIIERSLQNGTPIKQIEKNIQKTFDITQRRAKLIARDQTSKLNSSLTKLRQQEAGVEEYIWQTAGDERVRHTHKMNDGKKFRWDKPPKTGHPGTEINCRCVALPVLDKLLNL